MTPEELEKDQELFALCMKEAEEKVRVGKNPTQAKFEVLKAHGVQFDEDAAKEKIVGKMELSDEELAHVTGGRTLCITDYACCYVLKHDIDMGYGYGEDCFWDYECLFMYKCWSTGLDYMPS